MPFAELCYRLKAGMYALLVRVQNRCYHVLFLCQARLAVDSLRANDDGIAIMYDCVAIEVGLREVKVARDCTFYLCITGIAGQMKHRC